MVDKVDCAQAGVSTDADPVGIGHAVRHEEDVPQPLTAQASHVCLAWVNATSVRDAMRVCVAAAMVRARACAAARLRSWRVLPWMKEPSRTDASESYEPASDAVDDMGRLGLPMRPSGSASSAATGSLGAGLGVAAARGAVLPAVR